MIFIGFQFISGLMFGIELVWEDKAAVLDLGIFRFIIQIGEPDEE